MRECERQVCGESRAAEGREIYRQVLAGRRYLSSRLSEKATEITDALRRGLIPSGGSGALPPIPRSGYRLGAST